jgi:hypothetical protein
METKNDLTTPYYRVVYTLFIALALYQILVRQDFVDAASSMGIAMIFDPFDQTVSWKDRPTWQRAWLLVHLGIAAALLGYGIALGSRGV